MAEPDEQRIAALLRLLRQRHEVTQEQLSLAAGVPVRDIARIEAGDVGRVALHRTQRLFAELGGRARLSIWWHGAAADRLLDERHAALAELGAATIARYGWVTPLEVTFSEYGERGSIDIFGHRRQRRAVAVCEVKSAFGSLEEMNRSLDAKVRLAPIICRRRLGWQPEHIARLLIVPPLSSIRRVVATHAHTMDQLYPARGREIRAWLRRPVGDIGGIWFLSDLRNPRTVEREARVSVSRPADDAETEG